MSFDYEALAQKVTGQGLVIAMDGPSGAGKSSVAKAVAKRLGLSFLDTGAMYRAATWWALETGVDLADGPALAKLVANLPLKMEDGPEGALVWVNGADITEEIRSERVTSQVSQVAAVPEVRKALIGLQRKVVQASRQSGKGTVLEGRDTTTVVTPDADLRLLVTASLEERMRRRGEQLGPEAMAGLKARDEKDSKVNNFTTPAPGVTLVDTTNLDLESSIAAVAQLVEKLLDLKGEREDDRK